MGSETPSRGAVLKTLAYLDAGSGSILLQAILGGLAGIAVLFKLVGHRITRVLFFWRKPAAAAGPVEPDNVPAAAEEKSG